MDEKTTSDKDGKPAPQTDHGKTETVSETTSRVTEKTDVPADKDQGEAATKR